MPTDQLSPVVGDPGALARAAMRLESIAADVDATSARLRAVATSRGSWSGTAASRAITRTITLPPKLGKVHDSYSTAGSALRTYADALADAQVRSASAVRAATLARVELRQARSAYEAAARHDAEAARAATAAGTPVPSATAPRFEQAIADAEARLRRAKAANAEAHDDQDQAARHAAASLKQASHQGIRNKSWWHHVVSSAAHWAHAAWVDTLRFVSKVAVTVSAVAGLAALVLAVAGVVFPPLEAAAGALETISFASAAVALAADTGLAMTGDASWVGVGVDALALVPAIGSAGVRRFAPVLRKTRLISTITRLNASPSRYARTVVNASTVVRSPREVLATPRVSDGRLRNIIGDLYKGTTNPHRVGHGTTADAIRHELATGQLTAGRAHVIKGREYARALTRWLIKSPDAPWDDRIVAQSVLDDLRAALRGE